MVKIISTDRAPGVLGPYGQAVVSHGFAFLSGQIALDPKTGRLIEGDVTRQTERVLNNLRCVLEAAGLSLANVVKTTVYLADINDFQAMNDAYVRHLGSHRPARATVEVAALPMGARVEIEAIAELEE
ncbi:MAG: Rid family detoxifying hydrolase [Planctomycetota bacterium]